MENIPNANTFDIMDDKINYHLASLIAELKNVMLKEASEIVKNALREFHSENKTEENAILTIEELAAHFKISKSHINKLREIYEDFPVLLIGTSVRYDRNEIYRFIKNKSLLKNTI